jgi:hypothetical protein
MWCSYGRAGEWGGTWTSSSSAAWVEYGGKLLPRLSEKLTEEFGRGFVASNLRYMRLFYLAFPNCDALRHELSWTHYRTLFCVEDEHAREWYANEAVAENRSSPNPVFHVTAIGHRNFFQALLAH